MYANVDSYRVQVRGLDLTGGSLIRWAGSITAVSASQPVMFISNTFINHVYQTHARQKKHIDLRRFML